MIRDFLSKLFSASLFSEPQAPKATPAHLAVKKTPPKAQERIKPEIEHWDNHDKAAQHFFHILGAPATHIASNRAYKTWSAEFEISDALQKIENGEWPQEICALFGGMIRAFDTALESGEFQNFRQKSNAFTIAYSLRQFADDGGYQDHRLSIGCPLGMKGAPRVLASMTKRAHQTHNLAEYSGMKISIETEYDNLDMIIPAPPEFTSASLQFFQYLETAYNPENAPDTHHQRTLGDAYSPSGTLS